MKNIFILIITSILMVSCSNIPSKINDEKWIIFKNKFINSNIYSNIEDDGEFYFSRNNSLYKENKIYNYGSIKQSFIVKKDHFYTMFISGIKSAHNIWLDGELVASKGQVASTLNKSIFDENSSTINFKTNSTNIDIVIEFSNQLKSSKYLYDLFLLGDTTEVHNIINKNKIVNYYLVGVLTICFILFFFLYLVNIKNKQNLFIFILLLTLSVKTYFISDNLEIINFIKWSSLYKITQFLNVLSVLSLLLFLSELYQIVFKKKSSKVMVYLSISILIILLLPINTFYKFNHLIILLLILLSAYIIINNFIVIKKNRAFGKTILIANFLFCSSILSEYTNFTNHPMYTYIRFLITIFLVVTIFLLVRKDITLSSKKTLEKQQINNDIRSAFTKFVPLNILESLGNKDLLDKPPGDFVVKVATMMFIDIRDFTKLSQGLSPHENFDMINQFYEIVGKEVYNHNGYIESYGGDGVKAIFVNKPDDAVQASLNISREVFLTSKIKIGMSIHFGKIVLGIIGSKDRIQATAVSDVTRLLSSMDHFQSKMGIEILLTEKSYILVNVDKKKVLYLGNIILKDSTESTKLYQLFPEEYEIDKLFNDAFSIAVKMLDENKYIKALNYFQLAYRYKNTHLLTAYYIKHLEIFFQLKELKFTLKIS